jgi:hypothetical protein
MPIMSFIDPIPNATALNASAVAVLRFCIALTGSSEIPSCLTQEIIENVIALTEEEMLAKYACVGDPLADLSETEYNQWIIGVACYAAYNWVKYPENSNLVVPAIETVKIGPVTERFNTKFQDPDYIKRIVLAQSRNALKGIACIKAGLTPIKNHNVVSYRAAQENDGEIIFVDRGISTNVNV